MKLCPFGYDYLKGHFCVEKRTSKIDKWIKEGQGTGSGRDYQPCLEIQDDPSLDRSVGFKKYKNRQTA